MNIFFLKNVVNKLTGEDMILTFDACLFVIYLILYTRKYRGIVFVFYLVLGSDLDTS